MAKVSRLAMMAGGLGLALFTVAALKSWIGNPTGSSLSVEVPTERVEESSPPRLSRQPQVLQAKPLEGQRSPSPAYRDGGLPPQYDAAGSPGMQSTPASATGANPGVAPAFPQVPNALAEDLLDSAIRLPSNPAAGWPEEPPPTERQPQPESWTTQANDSLWDISVSRYGSGDYYHALFAHNRTRIHRPDRIEPGIVLETPSVETLRSRYPELCPAELTGSVAPASSLR